MLTSSAYLKAAILLINNTFILSKKPYPILLTNLERQGMNAEQLMVRKQQYPIIEY